MPVRIPIYLDNSATTPCDPRVVEAMIPYLGSIFGNAASRTHTFGQEAMAAVEEGRGQVAALIGASPEEIVFTSGATESDNLALIGGARYLRDKGRHLIVSNIEHKAILDSAHALEREGFEVSFLAVGPDGLLDPEAVRAAIRPDTTLCSVMLANNEIGTIQPIREIGAICRESGVLFHCDAVQGLGRLPFQVADMNVDLLSVSAHKMYGPKGIGALYVRKARKRIRLEPLIHGGGHERGFRSGTLPVHQIVGFGMAADICRQELAEGAPIDRIRALRDRLWDGIRSGLDLVQVNGSLEHRLPNNLNVSFTFVEGEAFMLKLPELAVSSGSACTSASLEPSYVLRALGLDPEVAHCSIRFGLGRFTTEAEIDFAVEIIVQRVRQLRELSPLYEMHNQGIDLKSIVWAE